MPEKITATGAQILTRCLSTHGIRKISCVAGESYLAVLDALLDHPEINVITCRQEGGAAFMAESWGKLDPTIPGVCMVTRGPGACNASIGVHTAMQDSTPMLLFIGQVARGDKGREAFQEIDIRQVFGGLAKWATEIEDASRIPEIIARAVKTATSGRPGPVVIGLPEDVLTGDSHFSFKSDCPRSVPIFPRATQSDIDTLVSTLGKAKNPIAILGGTGWTDATCHAFEAFGKQNNIPVATSFRRQDLFDHTHPNYIGELGTGPNPALLAKIKESDCLLVLGARLDEIMTQGYTLPAPPTAPQTLIHVHPAESELGKVYVPTLAIQADVNSVCAAIADAKIKADWSHWLTDLRQLYEQWTKIDLAAQPNWQGANMTAIFDHLRNTLPKDSIITTDAGNFSGWAQRYLRYGRPGRLLAPISGAMGYSIPSAIGASLGHPDKQVLGLCGDGGFLMNGQEIATAMHHGATPIIMVCNNGMYGTIRMHQMRDYPNRTSATTLTNPDFAALAKSYGAFGTVVNDAKDFPAIFKAASAAKTIAVIEVRMDPRQLTTRATL